MLLTLIPCGICLFVFAGSFSMVDKEAANYSITGSMFSYLFMMATGPKIISHIVNSEIFPLALREVSYGLAKIVFFTANFFVVQLFPMFMQTDSSA